LGAVRPFRLAIPTLAIVGVGAVLSACAASTPSAIDAMASVTYSQEQAVPDFDDGEYVMEGDYLIPLQDLMRKHDIDPATYPGGGTACPGSISTDVTVAFSDDRPDASFSMEGCGDDTDFATQATFLLLNFTEAALMRDNGFGRIAYSQYQPSPGYDLREHMQDKQVEIARFVALLRKYDVDPDGYVSVVDPECTGTVDTTVALFGTEDIDAHVVARMELSACGASVGFDAEATELLSEWHRAELFDSDSGSVQE
jgi:hypothetical protein